MAPYWSAEVRKLGDPGGARQTYSQGSDDGGIVGTGILPIMRVQKKPASLAEDERLIRYDPSRRLFACAKSRKLEMLIFS